MDSYLAVVRFLHIGAGITWIGILYYFNFIQAPAFARMEASARSNAVMVLVPRALLWFRHAAWVTVALGLLYVLSAGLDQGWDIYAKTSSFKSILVGGTLGVIMLGNVWLIIWPNQKKIIAGELEGDALAKAKRSAFLASRTNAWLSIPMLIGMIAANHGGIMF